MELNSMEGRRREAGGVTTSYFLSEHISETRHLVGKQDAGGIPFIYILSRMKRKLMRMY